MKVELVLTGSSRNNKCIVSIHQKTIELQEVSYKKLHQIISITSEKTAAAYSNMGAGLVVD